VFRNTLLGAAVKTEYTRGRIFPLSGSSIKFTLVFITEKSASSPELAIGDQNSTPQVI
jgi:hypothetical protein